MVLPSCDYVMISLFRRHINLNRKVASSRVLDDSNAPYFATPYHPWRLLAGGIIGMADSNCETKGLGPTLCGEVDSEGTS
jgi:hypothetical protein